MEKWKPIVSLSELKEGDKVKHIRNGDLKGIVVAHYGIYVIVVDAIHISNPPEWLVLKVK